MEEPLDGETEDGENDLYEYGSHGGWAVRVHSSALLKTGQEKAQEVKTLGQRTKKVTKNIERTPRDVLGPRKDEREEGDNTKYVIENVIDRRLIKGMLIF